MSEFFHKLPPKMILHTVFLAGLILVATAPVSPAQTNPPAAPTAPPLSPDGPIPKEVFLAQHEAFLKRKAEPIRVLFIGDENTAGWNRGGKAVWASRYAKLDAANFSYNDRIEQMLWRIANGELDGISPKVVILEIGTDNNNDRAAKITAGVTAIVKQINEKLPQAKLLLLGIFPRGTHETDHLRKKMAAVNAELAKLSNVSYLEIWEPFLAEDGSIPKEVMPDALHLSARGYQIWADAMQPTLDNLLK